MKRPKKATPEVEKFESWRGKLICPCCKTTLISSDISPDILRLRCFHCTEPIDLDWPEEKE